MARLLVLPLLFAALSGSQCFNIPLPGGRSIRLDEGGILRIQLEEVVSDLPKVPPVGTKVASQVLESLKVRDTGTCKGFGVFTTEPLNKHVFLGFYEGTRVRDKAPSGDYVMSIDGGATFLDGYERAQDRSTMSPVHLNHADKGTKACNCLRLLEDGNVAFFTARAVEAGEELCFDYGTSYWEGRESEKI